MSAELLRYPVRALSPIVARTTTIEAHPLANPIPSMHNPASNNNGHRLLGQNLEAPHRVLFAYWGRRGALARLTLDLARSALLMPELAPVVSVSRQNELYSEFQALGDSLMVADTFSSGVGAVHVPRLLRLRAKLARVLQQRRIETVIAMMPHVWCPFVMPVVRRSGRRYALIVHDALPHPGDPTNALNGWLLRDAANANVVITLREAVSQRLSAAVGIPPAKIVSLFHPDLNHGPPVSSQPPAPGEAFRILFFGRLLPYKGMPMFVEAVELLRNAGVCIEIGVFGEGDLRAVSNRLHAIGAEVVNRWIPDEQVARIFSRYHAVVLAHTEASQSGVIATAHGLGLPVIATPVGGLPEQIREGITGLLAERTDPISLAASIRRLAENPELYRRIRRGIADTRHERSMERFVTDLVRHARFSGA